MKTQTATKKYSMLLFSTLASLLLMTAACQKGGGSNNNTAVNGIYPSCTVQPCAGGVGQVPLYGGTASSMITGVQAQFQVVGESSGVGYANVTGQVVFMSPYVCQIGSPYLSGPFTIQSMQPGTLYQDVFDGVVNLAGPQATLMAKVHAVPARPQNTGLLSLTLLQCRDFNGMNPVIEMNF
jgi:hypothetical protein